jgi:hypothetical protein
VTHSFPTRRSSDRLARAVRAEQADSLAAAEIEADTVDDLAFLEGLSYAFHGEPAFAGIRLGRRES